jgi:hypothetical protein
MYAREPPSASAIKSAPIICQVSIIEGYYLWTNVGMMLTIQKLSFLYLCSMETTITSPVTFTNQAIKEISRLMAEEGFDKSNFLRVGVKGGGCSGMTYVLGFDQKLENDEV